MTGAKLYIYNGVGAKDLYIDEAHMALDIFRFVIFAFQNCQQILNNFITLDVLEGLYNICNKNKKNS